MSKLKKEEKLKPKYKS